MTDKEFVFGKGLFELLQAKGITYSCPLEGHNLLISDWQDVSSLDKLAIETSAASYGFDD